MMQERWIVVNDRQGRMLAEAQAERLARLARTAVGVERPDPPAQPGIDWIAVARSVVSRQLFAVGARLAAEPRLANGDCPET